MLSARPDIEVFSPRIGGREMVLPKGLEHILFHALVRARLELDTHPKFDDNDAVTMFLSGEDNCGYTCLEKVRLGYRLSRERSVPIGNSFQSQ